MSNNNVDTNIHLYLAASNLCMSQPNACKFIVVDFLEQAYFYSDYHNTPIEVCILDYYYAST